mgnify:CR=1 FL=1
MTGHNIKNKIPYTKPSITELEIEYATDAASNGWGNNCYAYIDRFEKAFKEHLGVKYAIATSSCTGAIHMGLSALGIGPGDEVILADTNWIASASPITYLGAKPVFVDILSDTWCLDPDKVESLITSRTKAIIAVHLYGNLCEMDRLLEIGEKYKIIEIIKAAKDNNCSIRVGINAGSLEKDILEKFKEPCPEALVESALRNIKILEDENFFNLKVSVKSSDVFLSIEAYKQLSKVTDYPLHLGVTEAGSFVSGSIKSSIGIGSLLLRGIGDTIRVSLSDDPVKEVKIGNEILKSLNLRNRGVKIISCPSCARQGFQVIDTVKILEEKLSHIKTPLTLSIIGCVVNGPGEAAMTDVGITGGRKGNNMLYLSGVQTEKVMTNDMISKVVNEVEKKAAELEKNSK